MKELIRNFIFVQLLWLGPVSCASAPDIEKLTEHTFRLQDSEQGQKADIKAVSWLVGAWHGNAFGDLFEETWNPPSGGTMVGMVKFLEDGKPNFYELMLITEENDSLVLKVKHFSSDFSAWEEKPDYVSFPLVKIEPDAIHFSGLSYYRQKNGSIIAYLAMKRGDEYKEERLIYKPTK